MNNLGRAIYIAGFSLMFIFAATTSIYLYGSLNSYLDSSADNLGISARAEGLSVGTSSSVRPIDRGEIYIILFNMEQMHVSSVTVQGNKVTPENVTAYVTSEGDSGKMPAIMNILNSSATAKFSYSFDGSNAIYSFL